MRKKDVKILLEHVKAKLTNIKKKYDQSLHEKDIPGSLRVDIKNVMENLRSSLEYMAQDVHETLITPYRKIKNLKAITKVYFPYGKDEQHFRSSIKHNLPDLEIIKPDIYFLIKSMQPHVCNDTWLYDFCTILNDTKHISLSPQIRILNQTYSVGLRDKRAEISASAGAIKAPPGAISIENIPIQFDPTTGIPKETPGLEISIKTWVCFLFQGTKRKVYPLLETAFHRIEAMSEKFYEIIR